MKKLGVFIPIFLTIVMVFSIISNAYAASAIIYSDPSDGWARSDGIAQDFFIYLFVGDTPPNVVFHNLIKFSLSGINEAPSGAFLYLYVCASYLDGVQYASNPLPNPGLGDCLVRHIDNYGTLDATDYDAPSIGNDPGILIGSTDTPNAGWIAIDITAAMRDDINNGRAWSAFLIKMAIGNDSDDDQDGWMIWSFDHSGTDQDPYIEYTFTSPVGGIVAPANKISILAPYIALVGLIGAISSIFVIVKKRRA